MTEFLKVRICGIPYRVVLCCDHFGTDMARSCGQTDYNKQIIKINTELAEDVANETICHEIVHAMLTHLGYQDESNNETFVQGLANAIHGSFEIKWEKENG